MKHAATKTRWLTTAALLAMALCNVAPANASVDTTPAPGGVYKLKPGTYVAEDTQCEAASKGSIRQYDGRGISTATTRACTVRVRGQVRNRYTVEQSCVATGAAHGHGRRQVQRQQVTVRSNLEFTQTIGRDSTAYRYCPTNMLPRDVRGAMR